MGAKLSQLWGSEVYPSLDTESTQDGVEGFLKKHDYHGSAGKHAAREQPNKQESRLQLEMQKNKNNPSWISVSAVQPDPQLAPLRKWVSSAESSEQLVSRGGMSCWAQHSLQVCVRECVS